MFLLDGDDRLAFVTKPLADVLGTDVARVTGTALESHLADGHCEVATALEAIRTADGRTARCCACRLRAAGEGVPVEIEFVSLSGDEFGEVLGTVRRGPRRKARSELAAARERFGHLFDLIQDAVVEVEIVGVDPVVRSVNPAFETVFGYDAETVLGDSLNDHIVPADHGGEALDFDERTAAGKPNRAVVTRQTADGRREFLYRGVPYEREGGGQYGFAIYSDITERKRTREQLRVLQRIMRHNLRNQLTVLHGMGRRVQAATTDSEIESAAERIIESAEALSTVSRKAQNAADALRRAGSEETVDAAAQARAVVDRERAGAPEATIDLDLPEAMPVSVGPELVDAIENLVENAREHGGTDPEVCVMGAVDGAEAVLTVADDGPGIPGTEREAIFGDGEITQLRHGSGIGLWLVKWIVESAGGRLAYEREDGWTAVTMRLPRPSDTRPLPADD